uniref:Uncharacterized protein n=1 Tax=Mus musculus TaxID=10090 RepID=Q3USV5_MOUSE|nr:unnamed protein product [Mus musculus]
MRLRAIFLSISLAFLAFRGPEPQASVGYIPSASSGRDPSRSLQKNSQRRPGPRAEAGQMQARPGRAVRQTASLVFRKHQETRKSVWIAGLL